ncbi:hypothetical protein A3C09_04710 [Candidatus Uhrbacteria bacterium RIFCSPHIGHO2_02_FULL_47_44]|uniref:Glycogen debranching enzyme C-terminal domain-containing protein n=1 Tax=Candidatus Uhrbacteria bacterium RIFCSPLOWO2_02_FULL_48_18 TaxID=1802408 RepID=A0A1F7VCI4_9BACT|nr:MAG: hypothetical protein A2839_01015 [Candidatus Uhrbacteria bacterium RIFCSPHIGHO2_01_FULL_47_10]OGL71932.1 MAG: hypothetical protein A3C09_04710 [Candidatus Uhrbacteria bacterium RIFCSPHIGHO2_02_FULL_47_44]OGL76542.1 MAG: hypothetical protein A3E97_02755 [Candidatus Uhrbacteria bacterium RIFCSPHIGHO2_12_FULL_47_12]OGL80557.1 MAG: hypothetical protein A3B20_04105 [Candidatus Uhrbacteria bacterium RIFCSPLOWO2_01_FULL_47_17]OGL88260.1 MAG: hypothetical protein A3I41_00875 [Candidatus Uhrbact
MKHLSPKVPKVLAAELILERCIGTHGVWADPTRYRFQCWTRDFALAILPLLIERKEFAIARTHLQELTKRVRKNGQVPILFLDKTLPFLTDKIVKSIRDRKVSFMLRRFASGNLWNLTPGTRDSEVAYLVAVHEYAFASHDQTLITENLSVLSRVMHYIEHSLMTDGLLVGCDWRDTMHIELAQSALLTNNTLLYRVYDLMRQKPKAHWMQHRVNQKFWNGTSYQDAPNREQFDPLGGALAVLHGVVPRDRYTSVIESFRSVDSPHGVTIKCKHNPFGPEEQEVIKRTDGVVVWPFIVGFSILALIKMGEMEFAREQFEKLNALNGFREWYDPATGKGFGAHEQLWSATLYLRTVHAFEHAPK